MPRVKTLGMYFMINQLLVGSRLEQDLSLNIPLQINGINVQNIALLFEFSLINGNWSGIKSEVLVSREWYYLGKPYREVYQELSPASEALLVKLDDYSYFDQNSTECNLQVIKRYRYPRSVDTSVWTIDLSLVYEY